MHDNFGCVGSKAFVQVLGYLSLEISAYTLTQWKIFPRGALITEK